MKRENKIQKFVQETVEEFLKRGGEVKKITDYSNSYKKYRHFGGVFKEYKIKCAVKLKKQNVDM